MELRYQSAHSQQANHGQAQGFFCKLALLGFLWVLMGTGEAAGNVKQLGVNDELPRLTVYVVSPPMAGEEFRRLDWGPSRSERKSALRFEA